VRNTGLLPIEVKSDHFAEKDLTPFYQKLASHVRLSAVGNARDKVIEPMFARFNREVLKDYPNWSGSNITARKADSHPNREHLLRIKGSFPDADEIHYQIAEAIDRWNNKVRRDGTTKLQQWNQAQPHELTQRATLDRMIDLFGHTHEWTNRMTKEGLVLTINGQKQVYRLMDHAFAELIGADFQVKYYPDDLSMVLATDPSGKTWKVPSEHQMPMTWTETSEGDRAQLNERLEFKRAHFKRQVDKQRDTWDSIESMGAAKYLMPDRNGISKHSAQALEDNYKQLEPSRVPIDSLYDDGPSDDDGRVINDD